MFILGYGIKQYIAKKQIKYSNSMVEVVFRQLKQKFINGNKPKDLKEVYLKLSRFIEKYNNQIPHHSLDGATPRECYVDGFNIENFQFVVHKNLIESKQLRRIEFCKCRKCNLKFCNSNK